MKGGQKFWKLYLNLISTSQTQNMQHNYTNTQDIIQVWPCYDYIKLCILSGYKQHVRDVSDDFFF